VILIQVVGEMEFNDSYTEITGNHLPKSESLAVDAAMPGCYPVSVSPFS
jgi:hypothetical protein